MPEGNLEKLRLLDWLLRKIDNPGITRSGSQVSGIPQRALMRAQLGKLFEAMRDGGLFGVDSVPWFNGGLFNTINIPALAPADVSALKVASELNWSAMVHRMPRYFARCDLHADQTLEKARWQ